MKKTNVIIAKALTIAMSATIFGSTLPGQAAQAATRNKETQIQQSNVTNGVAYEDSDYKISETSNTRTVLDKKSNHKVVVKYTDSAHSKGIYIDENGKEKEFYTDASGSIYLDNKCFLEANRTTVPVKTNSTMSTNGTMSTMDYWSSDYFFGSDGYTYYYVSTTTYNTKVQGDSESIALGVLAFVPYVGYIYGIAAIIETIRNFGADTMYIVEQQYCTSDYSHYAYKNYFYSDKGHTNLVSSNVVYKRMF